MTPLLLTPVEARVIAALSEKSIATPQYYPMTVNAIMLASNQKSSRDPVLQLHEGEVGAALLDLAEKGLARRDDAGGRVPKWRQSFQHHLLLQPPAFAVLVTLILRGPQTPAELRSNASALGGPADAEGVAAVLKDFSDRAQPLVVLLPRAPGQKEARYAHTLSGPPELPAAAPPDRITRGQVAPTPAPRALLAELEEKIRALEARVAALEAKGPP
jgi:uncharacterized protein YceH (UPF0502 family)